MEIGESVESALGSLLAAWGLPGETPLRRLAGGLINASYLYTPPVGSPSGACLGGIVFQRINPHVFPKPLDVIENFLAIQSRLEATRADGRYPYRVLRGVPCVDGRHCHVDGDGFSWRATEYLENTHTLETMDSPERACQAAKAFGHFGAALSELKPASLRETIAGFHVPAARLDQLRRARAQDSFGRMASCDSLVEFMIGLDDDLHEFSSLQARGLPVRACHNDAKLANLLFDPGNQVVAVIDLDTTMPGSPLFDYGDLVRSSVNARAEDYWDPDQANGGVRIQEDVLAAIEDGYLEGWAGRLSPLEAESLNLGARVICLEQAMRFLTDYLQGDRYYRCSRDGHNLDRARNQLALYQLLREATR